MSKNLVLLLHHPLNTGQTLAADNVGNSRWEHSCGEKLVSFRRLDALSMLLLVNGVNQLLCG